MKKLTYLFLLTVAISCSKSDSGGNGGGGNAQEPAIVFTTDANPQSNTSLSSTFPVVVTLNSAMPSSSGINISATVQTNNATIAQNAAINSITAINNIQLINLPRQQWCTVTIKVTSVATPSNFATRTFNVAYK